MTALQAPFPWFGGKSRVSKLVWERFGSVRNYVEPFFGSGAVLLGRPQPFDGDETINDLDGLICNFWRSIRCSPDETAAWAVGPIHECELHARHIWMVEQCSTLAARLEGDPEWHDPRIAGYWVYGMALWIGGEFCSGKGPWRKNAEGMLVREQGKEGCGVERKRPQLQNSGRGVQRRLPCLNSDQGVMRAQPGVQRRRLNMDTCGIDRPDLNILAWFQLLSERFRRVRVCCGDWSRVCGPTPTHIKGLTAVFLDPPYGAEVQRHGEIYRAEDLDVAVKVREWCLEQGSNPLMRIALCGYEGEHELPADWECVAWKANLGMASNGKGTENRNRFRERIWFSPHCLGGAQGRLFE